MMPRRSTLPLLAVAAASLAAVDVAAVKQACRADVTRWTAALIHGDFNRFVELTYPKVVASMGGRDKMIQTLTDGFKTVKAKGMPLPTVDVAEPTDPVAGGSGLYVIVPYTLTTPFPGGRVRRKSFAIGISTDGGQSWRYVRGESDAKLLKAVLPDLPAALKLPPPQPPVVEKD